MPIAHYFETYVQISPKRMKDILLEHGVVIGQYRNPLPKEAEIILTPSTIQAIWKRSTGQDKCKGGCRGTGSEHQKWKDLSNEQKLAFNHSVVRAMSNSIWGTAAASLLIEDPRFPGIALTECGEPEKDPKSLPAN